MAVVSSALQGVQRVAMLGVADKVSTAELERAHGEGTLAGYQLLLGGHPHRQLVCEGRHR